MKKPHQLCPIAHTRVIATLALLSTAVIGCALETEETHSGPNENLSRQGTDPVSTGESSVSADAPARTETLGVVLDDGRVITEQESRTGLTPKAGSVTTFRLDGPLFATSIPLLPASTHVCVLSLVWGTLYADGGAAEVYIESGTWRLHVRRPSASASNVKATADATCFPWSNFQTNGSILYGGEGRISFSGTGQRASNLWWGDAASALNGVRGKFFGGGERAWVEHASATDLASRLFMKTEQGGAHGALGVSFFVGAPGGSYVPQFIGPNGLGGAHVAGEYAHDFDGRQAWTPPFIGGGDKFRLGSVTMAHSSEAMCYLTSITGRFNGGDEWVQIALDESGFWKLWGRAKIGTEGRVFSRARCFRYRQFS